MGTRTRKQAATPDDAEWMTAALRAARQGEGLTAPNPPVGAVIVKDGRLIASGYHRRVGTPHAEIHALRAAGTAAKGATLYVTLEPCSTQGRTGPCTTAILTAGIRRVVVGVRDPNPRHAGRGLRLLRRQGVDVSVGVCADDAARLIAPFARHICTGLPLVTLKLAVSLDGRLADAGGQSQWLSAPPARKDVQRLRRGADAILVGVRTVLADDPRLTRRPAPAGVQPWRVVADTHGRTPPDCRLLNDDVVARTIIATTAMCPPARRRAYERSGAQVWVLPRRGAHLDPSALMRCLGDAGVMQVLCEGGGTLAGGLLAADLVDRVVLYVCPLWLGGPRGGVGERVWRLPEAPRWQVESSERLGADVRIELRRA